jgi:hypothetical protein
VKITPQPGSENPLPTGKRGLFDVHGADSRALREAALICYPSADVTARIGANKRRVSFKAASPGTYLVAVAAYTGSRVIAATYEVLVEGDPPPPPPPGEVATVLIVEESGKRSRGDARAITDVRIREEITEAGWLLRVVDDDTRDQRGRVPRDLEKWLKQAERRPWWFLLSADGRALVSEPLPGRRVMLETIQAARGVKRLNETVARSPLQCPGGPGCECCRPGCDCGCRDACPVFRRLIRRGVDGTTH